MKKDILFVINSLDGGGAEKSLVSLFHELKKYKNEYNFDILIPNKEGLFYPQIPEYINEIDVPKALIYMANGFKKLIMYKKLNPYMLYIKIRWAIVFRKSRNLSSGIREQKLWKLWGPLIPHLDKSYDVVISYMNGYPNYYVIDKVEAKKKCLWVHNEYQKIGYDVEYDKKYYENANVIVTVSELCKKSIEEVMPQLAQKIYILENICSGRLIHNLAKETPEMESFNEFVGIKILSIGRLVEQKNFHLAVDTSRYLKENFPNLNFKWFIIGKGYMRDEILRKIHEEHLEEYIELLGTTINPYSYIQRADILVQTSIFEGKSIVLDEAKILGKCIIATNYPTVYDSIQDRITGVISKQTPRDLATKIYQTVNNNEILESMRKNLIRFKSGNTYEVEKYIRILFDDLQ